jgi:hypothetical protein
MKLLDEFNAWKAEVPASSTTLGFVDHDITLIVHDALNNTAAHEIAFDHATRFPESCKVVLYHESVPFKSCTIK